MLLEGFELMWQASQGKANRLGRTVRTITMMIDKRARSRKKVPHVYCPGQSNDYPISKCKEYCLDYYKGLALGGISCSYHGAVTCHLELKSDPQTGKLRLTEVFG